MILYRLLGERQTVLANIPGKKGKFDTIEKNIDLLLKQSVENLKKIERSDLVNQ